jgi:hypothetical protein
MNLRWRNPSWLSQRVGWFGIWILAVAGLHACAENQDPNSAESMWDQIQQANYKQWARAPGYEQRRASHTLHGTDVDIYVNPVVENVLKQPGPIYELPPGSLIVKDTFKKGGEPSLIVAMRKGYEGWFWAEWKNNGDVLYSGRPGLCLDCHRSGEDFLRSFTLPK